jgi:hypothetical protein
MTKRTVFILWIIAIILGGAVASLKLSQNHATESATKRQRGQKLFDNFPAADVASVTIDGAGTSVHLAKKNNSWVVGEREDYPANAATVNEFLRTLGELKVSQGIEAGPSLARRFGMDAQASAKDDRGLTVTFKDASGKDLAAVSFGKSTSSAGAGAEENPMMGGATGRFVRNHSDESGIYVVNQAFPTLTDDAKRWLKEDFVQIEKIKSVSITRPGNADIAWKLTRDAEEGEFKLDGAKDKETLDPTVTSPLKSLFSYARFDDVLPPAKAQEASKADEKRTVAIETFEGFNYNFTIAPKKTDPKTDVPKDISSHCHRQGPYPAGAQEGSQRKTRGCQGQGRRLPGAPQSAHRKTRQGGSPRRPRLRSQQMDRRKPAQGPRLPAQEGRPARHSWSEPSHPARRHRRPHAERAGGSRNSPRIRPGRSKGEPITSRVLSPIPEGYQTIAGG